MKRLMIAAPKSGSGKTIVTCGLLELFKRRNIPLASFKCGPDYIDPLFHKRVLGLDSQNLDSFFESPQGLRKTFFAACKGKEEGLAMIEGVMGYFDGLGGTTARASAWEVASILECPVFLTVDARGSSLSLAALAKGFLEYEPSGFPERGKGRIAGLILNRVSPMIYPRLKETLEKELKIPVAGYLPPLDFLHLENRHLGLVLPEEIEDFREQIDRLADVLEETLDVEVLLSAAEAGGPEEEKTENSFLKGKQGEPFCLGVARDEAFCFYYRENIRAMEAAGAVIKEFSPIHDSCLPEGLDGLLLGGGYPELYAGQLEQNRSMRECIQKAALEGMPVLAECGGFLYLLETLEDPDGHCHEMAGVFSGGSQKGVRKGNFGYLTLTAREKLPFLPKGGSIRGHEFHYWQTDCPGEGALAQKPEGKKQWLCMRHRPNILAGFPHLYYPSCPEFVQNFGEKCREYGAKKRRKGQ